MKKQVLVMHGGDTFNSYEDYLDFLKSWNIDFEQLKEGKIGWKKSLKDELGSEFEVIAPQMPNKINAKYSEWKIWFEKFIPFLEDDIIFIGHSLGGTFFAKYLSENDFPKKIKATFLVAPAYDEKHTDESLGDFTLPESLEKFEKQGGRIFIYGSSDDSVVSPLDFKGYKNVLKDSIFREFTDRGHFNVEKIEELLSDIKSL